MTERTFITNISPLLLDMKFSTEKRMFDQVWGLVDSQVTDAGDLVDTVRAEVERMLPLHLLSASFGAKSAYALGSVVKELRQEPHRATVASRFTVYRTGMEEKPVSDKNAS